MPILLELIKRFLIFCSKYLMLRYAGICRDMQGYEPKVVPQVVLEKLIILFIRI